MKKVIFVLIYINLLNSLHFVKKWEIPSGDPRKGRIYAYDADRDGKIELYIKSPGTSNNPYVCYIYELDGINWIKEDSIICGSVFFPWGIGDFDLDGYIDIFGAWASDSGFIGVSVYESPDSFSYPTNGVWRDTINTGGPKGTYDIDQDGFSEFVTYIYPGKIGIYEARGDNQYELIFLDEDYRGSQSTYAFGDFDDDGKIEFVSGDMYGKYWIYEARANDIYYRVLKEQLPTYNIIDCF